MRKIALLCVVIHIFSFFAFSAEKRANISTKGIAEGMAVHAITQDSSGMIWLATETGLCSFDGYDMRLFDGKRIGLVNVMEICGDTLLIGGTKGLFKFLLKEKKFVDEVEYENEMIRTKSGEWIGTDKGLFRHGQRVGTLTDIFSVTAMGDDIFVSTINSLYRIHHGKEDRLLDNELFVGQILDFNGEYVLGTAKALLLLDHKSHKVLRQIELPVVKTMLSRDSIVYI